MARLLDLPNELIDSIADRLLPDSIEAFALSCKTIYGKCKYTLNKHHEYRAKYRVWSNHGPRRDDIFYFLCEIETDPLVAEYVETLSFWDRRPSHEITRARKELGSGWETWKDKQKMEKVVRMVETKLGAYLEALSINTDFWYGQLRRDANTRGYSDEHFVAQSPPDFTRSTIGFVSALTVLCLLPNLRELALHPDFPGYPYTTVNYLLFPIRQLFRYRPHDGTYPLPYRPLERLEKLLPYQSDSRDEYIPLEHVRPFLELPGLKEVFSTSGMYEPEDKSYLEEGLHLDYAPGWIEAPAGFDPQWTSLQLRRLELYDSCLNPNGIRVFLHCCTQLEVLKYVHATKVYGTGDNWSVGACVRAMGDTVGKSLKELYLRLRFDVNQFPNPVRSLREFAVLEKLETDVVLFAIANTSYGSHLTHPKALGTMLPPSIRNVKLHFKMEDDISLIPPLVNGLATARSTRLTNIEEVSINYYITPVHPESVETSRLAKERYAEARHLAENEGVSWTEDTLDPWREHWNGWPGEYRTRFASSIEGPSYSDDSDDDMPSQPSQHMSEPGSPVYNAGSPSFAPTSPVYSPASPTSRAGYSPVGDGGGSPAYSPPGTPGSPAS